MLPAALEMLLATMGTWGHFEPGHMFAGWFCWAVELTGGRAAASGKRFSHLISPSCHHTSLA